VTFFDELKRRNVLRVAAAYIVTAWLIIQVAETIFPQYGLEHHVRTVITILAIGFIPAMILAWALEWTPAGIRLDAGEATAADSAAAARVGRKFDRIVIVILTVALGWFVYDKLVPPAPDFQYSIAVLPFDNESPDAMPDYLADGLSGEVRDLLAKLPELFVIARTSAFSFKGQDVAIPEIGSRLGVSHLLTGAVTQVGTGLRIRARLLDAGSGAELWSKAYTGSLNDVFAIQDEIAGDVVDGLDLESDTSLPAARRTTPEVYALTLQARQLWYDEVTLGIGDKMAALLEEALEIDPHYTPAMVWMIYANHSRQQGGLMSKEEENERWLALAARILAIEPDNASAHSMFAWQALYVDRDLQAAASSYARALSSAPNDVEVLRTVARFAFLIGRKDDALAIIDRSMAVDPLCSLCLYGASRIYMYADRLDRAVALRQRFITMHDQGQYEFGIMKLLQGKAAEALAIFKDLEQRMAQSEMPNDGRAHAGLAMALHDLGRPGESDEQLAMLIDNWGEPYPEQVAQVYAWRNDRDEAFEWLEKDEDLAPRQAMMVLDPVYRNLHDDPRWAAVRAARGSSERQLAALEFPIGLLSQYRGQ